MKQKKWQLLLASVGVFAFSSQAFSACIQHNAAQPASAFPYSGNTEEEEILPSLPTTQFKINQDGTVTDRKTKLTWMRCTMGQTWNGNSCDGEATKYKWADAMSLSDTHSFAGHKDWKVPEYEQLKTIMDDNCEKPAINITVFPGAPADWFWSSTYHKSNKVNAWVVNFIHGYTTGSNTDNSHLVRLVRETK
jgi:hypothetical protein